MIFHGSTYTFFNTYTNNNNEITRVVTDISISTALNKFAAGIRDIYLNFQ